jgi:hypothetical protein
MLYFIELLAQDPTLRFGYADDIYLYRATHFFNKNIELLANDI